MSFWKLIFISFIIVASFSPLYSQSFKNEKVTCDTTQKYFDTVAYKNIIIRYKILGKAKEHFNTKLGREIFCGDVLIPKLNSKIDSIETEKIFRMIGEKHQIDELLGFKTCEAQRIYYQSMMRLPGQKEYLEQNFFGKFKN